MTHQSPTPGDERTPEGPGERSSRDRGGRRFGGGSVVTLPARGLIGIVRLYQITLSPLLGANCRFVPSCSEYFIQAVKKYGAVSGSVRGVLRICRCHPFHPGGYDPP